MKQCNDTKDIIFSIVIPIYNAEAVLDRTIQSVLNQSFKDYELLLIDDCSTDNSYAIAKGYENSNPQVHAYQLSVNSGSAILPVQKGVSLANGKYVLSIGNDDVINDVYLEKVYGIICSKSTIDVVIPLILVKNPYADTILRTYPLADFDMSAILTGVEACRMIIPNWTFSCNGMVIKKELFDYSRIENPYTYMNSDEFSSRILLYHARNVAFSKESKYTYYLYLTSITHKRSVKLFETLYTDTHLVTFSETHYDDALANAMCSKMLTNMICLYKAYRAEKHYTKAEQNRINEIFRETYSFLQEKKQCLRSLKHRLYLSNWYVFTSICVIMMQTKKRNLE